jgi:hypothetical protein
MRAREIYTEEYRRQQGRRAKVQYLENLKKLPQFADWLRNAISIAADTGVEVSKDVKEASYRHMYAHGMHFRIRGAEEEKVTCDSAIASAVWRKKSGREFQNLGETEAKEYVGWIEEILELNYCTHCCIVLVCSWVPTTLDPTNNKVTRDMYGFSLVNL